MKKDHPCYNCGKCCEDTSVDFHSTIDSLRFYLFAIENSDFEVINNNMIYIHYNEKECAWISLNPSNSGLGGSLFKPCSFINKDKTCDIYHSKINNKRIASLLERMMIQKEIRPLVCKTYKKYIRMGVGLPLKPIRNPWLRKELSKDCKMSLIPFYKNLSFELINEVNLSNNLNYNPKTKETKEIFKRYSDNVLGFLKNPSEDKAIKLLEVMDEYNKAIYSESMKRIKKIKNV